MDLTLLADEVWEASEEVQARAHDETSWTNKTELQEAHYLLQAAVDKIQRAAEHVGRATG